MLETFIKLLERFVVAHELIAANSVKTIYVDPAIKGTPAADEGGPAKELPVEGEDVIDVPEEKPARKPRQTKPVAEKPKGEPKGPDLSELRDEIKTIAKHIAAGDSDECADLFDELLEDFKVRTVTKLADDDVEPFHKAANKLVRKFYDVED